MRRVRNFGGRSRVATRTGRVRAQARNAAPSAACLTESFDGASWPIGSDLTWDEGHGASRTNGGGSTSDDGSNALKRTLHVVSNKLTIKAPDDSQLTGGHQWFRTYGEARATTELDGPDMQVTATIGGTTAGNGTPEWTIRVRTAPHVDEDLSNLVALGWLFYFNAPDYVFYDVGWDNGGSLSGGFVSDTATLNPGYTWTASDGDQVRVTITGTGDDTVVVAEAPIGNVALTLNLANGWGGPLSLPASSADFPEGTQAGAGLFVQSTGSPSNDLTAWNHGAWDDVLTLDDFEACPA